MRGTLCTLLWLALATLPARAAESDITPYLQTVTHALLNAPSTHVQFRTLNLMPERSTVPLVGKRSGFGFGHFRQSAKAPLAVVIPGFSGNFSDGPVKYLGEVLYRAGFEVVTVSNPMSWTFELSASPSGAGGYLPRDARDLYSAVERTLSTLRAEGREWTSISLVGFSLGAADAAFVAKFDAEEARIGFNRVVMINPPVDLLHDTDLLDSFYAEGASWTPQLRQKIKNDAFAIGSTFLDRGDLSPEAFARVMTQFAFPGQQLKFLIGDEFRQALADDIDISQLIHDRGFLPYPDPRRREPRHAEAMRMGFQEYARRVLIPDLTEQGKVSVTIESIAQDSGLRSLESFLATSDKVRVLHNANDFLLRQEDLEFLQQTMGNRLILFPEGGHGGNLWKPEFHRALVGALLAN